MVRRKTDNSTHPGHSGSIECHAVAFQQRKEWLAPVPGNSSSRMDEISSPSNVQIKHPCSLSSSAAVTDTFSLPPIFVTAVFSASGVGRHGLRKSIADGLTRNSLG
jgi:hypothetical protein